MDRGWQTSFWHLLEVDTVAHEMHAQEREIHAQARADHVAARGDWKGAVKASTSSWDGGEDPGGARQSCGGTKVYKSGLEKTELKTTIEPRTTRRQGVEKGQRRPTRQGGADPRWLNNEIRAQGKKREEKRRNGNRGGERWPH